MTSAARIRLERSSVFAVWGIAVLMAVAIGLFGERDRQLVSVSIAMLLLVFIAAMLQLMIARPEGFIHRMSLSLAGGVVVLAVTSGVFALLGASSTVIP